MTIPIHRYQSQIKSVLKAYDFVQQDFDLKLPIDNSLTRYFRTNKYLGSRDRKLISNAIFGFYRWYGWLNTIVLGSKEKALLLGYILDNNQSNDTVKYWIDDILSEYNSPLPFHIQADTALQEKLLYLRQIQADITIDQLVPDFTPSWVIDKLAFLQTRPNLWLRSASPKLQKSLVFLKEREIPFQIHPQLQTSIEVFRSFNINECPACRNGALEVQDISSQMIGLICHPEEKDVWWDVCAGSGGKSLHLAALTNGKSKIFATEIRTSALSALKKRIQKTKITALSWNGESQIVFPQTVTKALIDAPCSCSGTWRRNPEIRWQINSATIEKYATIQLKILENIAHNYSSINTIVYATCSMMPEENEHLIQRFLKKNTEFSILPIKHPITNQKSTNGIYFSPPVSDGNFMYAATLKRNHKS